MEKFIDTMLIIFIVLLVIGIIYMHFWGDCWLFNHTPQKDIPARCVNYFNN